MASADLSRREAALLLGVVVVAWGINWPVGKALLHYLSPLWATTLRSAVGTAALLAICVARGRLILPRRGDMPVVLCVGLLHMTAFSLLVSVGLQTVPAARSVVLAYTTPLWVVPGAFLLLREPLTRARAAGVMLGLAGLALIFNPLAFDWHDRAALLGNGLVLAAALCWAASILYVRAHRWVSPPFELTFWQALLATCVLGVLALRQEGPPQLRPEPAFWLLLLYGGVFGIALAYWALTTVNRALPAMATSLGLLGVPVFGSLCSALALGEPLGPPLLGAMVLIVGGVALGTWKGPGAQPAGRR
ncbi:DMT family transporter [Cupriavidus basilensis]|uniref:DMT family transporter n=1 Tax=Cupriavidus basilensis TaxID=68895 RepID=A0ABT6AXI0_9BURK|nr:DMT family transporter [Cupriavidus basilensis]MDF3837073.1 DMT family transporter [Cupriavidus basilensis]